MSDEELTEGRATQIREFTIASVAETRVITISEIEDASFNLIKKGNLWSVNNDNEDYQIEPVEYRVLSVMEVSQNEYQVTAMMYNRSKFNAIDRAKSLTLTQQAKAGSTVISDLPAELVGDVGDISSSVVAAYLYTQLTDTDGNLFFTEDRVQYDAIFPKNNPVWSTRNTAGRKLACDFGGLIARNKITNKNTGGYIIEVYKDGEKVRFSLDGYDNTTFEVYLGSVNSYIYVDFSIYRYDTSYKLESIGVPQL